MARKRTSFGTFIFSSKKSAQKKAKKLKRDKPAAWGVVRAPKGIKGWFVGKRSAYAPGWTLLGGGWMKEKGFK